MNKNNKMNCFVEMSPKLFIVLFYSKRGQTGHFLCVFGEWGLLECLSVTGITYIALRP